MDAIELLEKQLEYTEREINGHVEDINELMDKIKMHIDANKGNLAKAKDIRKAIKDLKFLRDNPTVKLRN
jgi:transcriptional antiterminator